MLRVPDESEETRGSAWQRVASPRAHPLWVVAGVGTAAAAAFAGNVAVTYLLPLEMAGNFLLLVSVAAIVARLLRLGVEQSVVRLIAGARARSDMAEAATWARAALWVSGTLFVGVGLVLGPLVWPVFAVDAYGSPTLASLAWPIAIWIAAEAGRLLVSECLRGSSRIIAATLLGDAGRALVFLGLLAGVWVFFPHSLSAVVIAAAASSAAVLLAGALMTAWTLVRGAPRGSGRRAVRPLLASSVPFYLASLSVFAINQGDVFIGGLTLERTDLAIYAAAAKLSLILQLTSSALALMVAPIIPALWARRNIRAIEHQVRSKTVLLAAPAVALSLVFIIGGSEVLGLIFPAPYEAGAPVLAILSIGTVTKAVAGPNGFVLLMTSDQRFVARFTAVFAVVQVAAMVLMSLEWGPIGLALASTLGTAVQAVVFGVRLNRRLGIRSDVGLRPWQHLRVREGS